MLALWSTASFHIQVEITRRIHTWCVIILSRLSGKKRKKKSLSRRNGTKSQGSRCLCHSEKQDCLRYSQIKAESCSLSSPAATLKARTDSSSCSHLRSFFFLFVSFCSASPIILYLGVRFSPQIPPPSVSLLRLV